MQYLFHLASYVVHCGLSVSWLEDLCLALRLSAFVGLMLSIGFVCLLVGGLMLGIAFVCFLVGGFMFGNGYVIWNKHS